MDTTIPLQQSAGPQSPEDKTKKRWQEFKSRINTCREYRKKLLSNWITSVDYRRGKPFSSQSDEDQVAVNLDWPMTKAKQAALYSQTPEVRVVHSPESIQAGPWVAKFERRLNDNLRKADVEAAMDECLPDVINASGFGVVLASYEAITEKVDVPAIDMATLPPEIASQAMQTGMIDGVPVPMEQVDRVVDRRYIIQRISPSDFLWPIEFTGSNFDHSPWIGRTGRITWAEAVLKYGLTEEDKDKVVGEDKTVLDRISYDHDKDKVAADEVVGFDEIFYKSYQFDENSKSYETIHHMVYLNGKEKPVIDEMWKGQEQDPESGVVYGSKKYPIRVATLTYITDEAIPPSDSAIGRPQVNELNKSRSQMIRQRERSLPIRWFDVNRLDPAIQTNLMRGVIQAMIPVQGDGQRVVGEVARANYPREDFEFDKIAKGDLAEIWTIGPNQMGSGDNVETKGESQEIATNFQTRIGRERARIASFFVGIAEVIGGLMCLYEDPELFGEGFSKEFSHTLCYSVLADSTVLVDANQRLQRLNQFLNVYAKSGWVNLEPVLKEIATLTGLDPNVVIQAPQPKPPVEPNISLRLTGTEDMSNPLTLAFLLKSGQAPTPEMIEQAKQLIQQAVVLVQPQPAPVPGAPPTEPPPADAGPMPNPPIPMPGEANPDATILPKITKRSDDPGEV